MMRRPFLAGFIALSTFASTSQAAVIFSEDFSGPDFAFGGWTASVGNFAPPPTTVDPDTSGYFNLVGGAAQISADAGFFINTLIREIVLPATTGTLTLSFDADWVASSPFGSFSAALQPTAGGAETALSGSSDDITALAGQSVALRFTLLEAPPFTGTLTLDDILIEETLPTALPLPGSPTLLGLGGLLLGLGGLTARRSR